MDATKDTICSTIYNTTWNATYNSKTWSDGAWNTIHDETFGVVYTMTFDAMDAQELLNGND